MMKNLRMSRTTHTTKRMRPAADQISPDEISGPGNPGGNMAGDEGLAPKKNSPFKNYAPITKPPLGRALPVRGEHNQNDRSNTQK